MKHLVRLGALALLTLAAPALAQEAPAPLDIAGARFNVPAPAGHCYDTPAINTFLETQRSALPDAVPDLVFMPCEATDESMGMYAIVVYQQGPAIERAAFLERARQLHAGSGDRMARANAVAEERFNTDGITIESGLKSIGVDAMCGYLAGVMSVDIDGSKTDAVIVACATVIGGRMVMVMHYSLGSDPAIAAGEAPLVRRIAESIVAVP